MGSIAGLNAVDSRKIYCFGQESNSDFIAVHPVTRRYTDWDIPAGFYMYIGLNKQMIRQFDARAVFRPFRANWVKLLPLQQRNIARSFLFSL
jgi:hypothetical protein